MQPCIEDIKILYYTVLTLNKGNQADLPVEPAGQELIVETINSTLELVLVRGQMLLSLAITLARTQANNPLRGLRYMLNCVLKVVEGALAVDVRHALLQHRLLSGSLLSCAVNNGDAGHMRGDVHCTMYNVQLPCPVALRALRSNQQQ